jgi:pyruvate dehydrogenase E1 component alpha subunit
MRQIRDFEDKAYQLYQGNKLRGSVHLCAGQEAIPAAIITGCLNDGDYITSTHRGHGDGIAKSRDLKSAFSELLGKETGFCHGRGGSMHICDLSKGNLGANAIVGGGIPIAVGGALAQRYRVDVLGEKEKHVSVTFFGDGASNQGTFHESINLAAVWKLPCIFVCENNHFGISTPTHPDNKIQNGEPADKYSFGANSAEKISDRAKGYNIPGYTIDGNDVIAVLDCFTECKERALAGDGPSLIEAVTYRYYGHWTGDPQKYRNKADINAWKDDKHDPLPRYNNYLIENGIAAKDELDKIDAQAQKDVDEAAEFALNAPEPDPAHVMDGMWVEGAEPK